MKKLLTILLLIMLIISFYQVTSMYALYKDELESEYSNVLGIWTVKINDTDVTSDGETHTFTISDEQLQYVESTTVADGKIAPGSQAYFDIVIDPTETDVSVLYKFDINIDPTTTANIKLKTVENYFKKDGETDTVANTTSYTEGNSYTSLIPVSIINQDYKNYIRMYFEWENADEYDDLDTSIGKIKDNTISIPLELNLKQYTGEVIGSGE